MAILWEKLLSPANSKWSSPGTQENNYVLRSDAVVYATAKAFECQVVASDKHFVDLDNVTFI